MADWTKKLRKLESVVKASRENLCKHRDHRASLVRQSVGKYFGAESSGDKVPLNILDQVRETWRSYLVANNPRALITSRYQQLSDSAKNLELAVNQAILEMDLGSTLEYSVIDGFFSPLSVVKVGLCRTQGIEIDGYTHDYGQPFADAIDLDDLVIDLAARRMDQISFIGDRYDQPFDLVMESGFYKNTGNLKSDEPQRVDDIGATHLRDINRSKVSEQDIWNPTITLQDIWLPRENLMLTFAANGDWGKPLMQREWEGPECGPYHPLIFSPVPGSILGAPPLSMIRDLHESANLMYNKMVRRAEDSKNVLGYTGERVQDAEAVRDASDMQFIQLNSAQGIKELSFGKPDQAVYALVQDALQHAKINAGNIDLLGGLSSQSDTLGQDRLLASNASKRMSMMQAQVLGWAKGIVESIAFYLWYDPIAVKPITSTDVESGYSVTWEWGPERREGDFLEYNFEIEPYSMTQYTPAERLADLIGFVQGVVLPALPMMQAQGKALDMGALFDLYGRYKGNEADVNKLIIDLMPDRVEEQPSNGRPTSSPVSTRTNVRVNKSGTGGPGRQQDQITQLMGGSLSPQQETASAR